MSDLLFALIFALLIRISVLMSASSIKLYSITGFPSMFDSLRLNGNAVHRSMFGETVSFLFLNSNQHDRAERKRCLWRKILKFDINYTEADVIQHCIAMLREKKKTEHRARWKRFISLGVTKETVVCSLPFTCFCLHITLDKSTNMTENKIRFLFWPSEEWDVLVPRSNLFIWHKTDTFSPCHVCHSDPRLDILFERPLGGEEQLIKKCASEGGRRSVY